MSGRLPPPFRLNVLPERERVRVLVCGELDLASAPAVDHAIRELTDRGFANVVLDLRELTFIDSTGVRLLIDHARAARDDGHTFAITEGTPAVERLLAVTGLTDHFARDQSRSALLGPS
jgi:anti-anti-sigma factor